MPYTRPKYSKELTQRWTIKAMIVLAEAQRDMTVFWKKTGFLKR